MKEAVALLDLVRAKNEGGLSRWLRWREGSVDGPIKTFPDTWYYEGPSGPAMLAGGKPAYTPSDIFSPAVGLVMSFANEKIQGHTVLALGRNHEGKPTLEVRVSTLLTAMWVQLASAVAEPTDFRRCKVCNRWFAVTEDFRQAERVFCQDACKSKDYRARKEKAQELAAAGKPAKVIAQELRTDLDTVKKWVGKRKK